MTAREFAAAINRPYPTVALWLRNDLIPEATSIQLGGMRVWQIPAHVASTFVPPKQGRPKGSKTKKAAAVNESKPAAKKRASKKAGN